MPGIASLTEKTMAGLLYSIALFIALQKTDPGAEDAARDHADTTVHFAAPKKVNYCIGFYNVENLFDTCDHPVNQDEEFTPSGKRQWTRERYAEKLENISRVVKAMNGGKGVDILGLSEVENRNVLADLVSHPELKKLNYGMVHHESPDDRGIDVAMIYRKNTLKVLGQKGFTVDISATENRPTRDVLLVTGILSTDTFHFLLNHWPSRREGRERSEPKRLAAARVVKKICDSLLLNNPDAKIVIMGDFNDNPTDNSVYRTLGAQLQTDADGVNDLYNPTNQFDWKSGQGTEFYRGSWSRFIQIIVTESVVAGELNGEGQFPFLYIFKPDWMLGPDPATGQMIPKRSGDPGEPIGYSDHLPVYMMLHVGK